MHSRTFRIIFAILLASAGLIGIALWLNSLRQIVQTVIALTVTLMPCVSIA
jgi:hypothetical protein